MLNVMDKEKKHTQPTTSDDRHASLARAANAALRGVLRLNEPMSKHTSWRTGGSAERFYIPADTADLANFLKAQQPHEPIYMIGLGSNLLVRDKGVSGTVILLHAALKEFYLAKGGNLVSLSELLPIAPNTSVIYAQAGVASPKVARFAASNGLVGAEFLAGIPGTIGGALAMNAGCYGTETWEIVLAVQTIDRWGAIHVRTPAHFEIGYRHVKLTSANLSDSAAMEEWFVGAWFCLPKGDGELSKEKIKELLTRRISTQPLNLPNAGSVFRNPPGDHAARLIESCGLKGLTIGGAQVSNKHANFIVNHNHATAADIEQLIAQVQTIVKQRCAVDLVTEVRIIGT